MPSIHFSNTFFETMTKQLTKIFVKEGNDHPRYWDEIFDTQEYDKERPFFQNMAITPLGLLSEVGENGIPDLDAATPGLSMFFGFQDYGLRYIITRRASQEDPKKIFGLLPRMLRRSVDDTMEYLFWNILNLSFLGYAQGGYNVDDGLSLINSNHTLTGLPGVTQSNFIGNTALTVESLNAVRTMFQLTKDDRGKLTPYVPKHLIYAPGYRQQVLEVLKSDMYPETDQNKINIASQARIGIEPFESPFLVPAQGPGPYPWWVTTAKGDLRNSHSMLAIVKENRQRSFVDVNNEALVHEAKIRVAWGVQSYRGIVGSGGA